MKPLTLTLSHGGTMAYRVFGDPAGSPMLAIHGSPGSSAMFSSLNEAAASAGVRLIAPDKVGCGGSSMRKLEGLSQWVPDLVELLDQLSLDTVPVMGVSGGGGYALAAGAVAPQRFTRVILCSAMIPGAPKSTLGSLLPQGRMAILLARRAPGLLSLVLKRTSHKDVSTLVDSRAMANVPEPDRALMAVPEVAAALTLANKEAVAMGGAGPVQDLKLNGSAPDFSYSSVHVPTHIVHGTEDRNVPVDVARWIENELPNTSARYVPGAHLVAVGQPGLVFDAL